MTVERFGKEEFEKALPRHKVTGEACWTYEGVQYGEHTYAVPVNGTNKRIMVRSSVSNLTGVSAGTGEDSIRLWVEYNGRNGWKPLGKNKRWTTRVPGWQDRMIAEVRALWAIAVEDSKAFRNRKDEPSNDEVRAAVAPAVVEAGESRSKTLSAEQEAIIAEAQNWHGHVVVVAGPGTGKSFTINAINEALDPSLSVWNCAYNTHIAKALNEKVTRRNAQNSTVHSKGFEDVRGARPGVELDKRKAERILNEIISRMSGEEYVVASEAKASILRLQSLAANKMRSLTDSNLDWIAERYGVDTNGDRGLIYRLARELDNLIRADQGKITFDEMVTLVATGQVPSHQFDVILVDETQDLNEARTEAILKSIKPGGRVIAVGDPNQSIYGFSGADTESIPNLIRRLDAKTLPLMTCYRCGKAIVREANSFVPDLVAAEWAEEGEVVRTEMNGFERNVKPSDLVLCRTNAPLVKPVLDLIARGVKAIIRGRDFADGLAALITKVQRKEHTITLAETLQALCRYVDAEMTKFEQAGQGGRGTLLADKFECIMALSDGCRTVQDVLNKIDRIFDDAAPGITFSSIHRAKGSEADTVYILRPDLIPHPKASQDWELQQEMNLGFVAVTRARKRLVYVDGR